MRWLPTGAALVALILAFGAISGAHFDPAVTLAAAFERGLPWRDVAPYLGAHLLGGVIGVALGNLMFALPAFRLSSYARNGAAQLVSEFVATFGLLSVIWGCSRLRPPTSSPLP